MQKYYVYLDVEAGWNIFLKKKMRDEWVEIDDFDLIGGLHGQIELVSGDPPANSNDFHMCINGKPWHAAEGEPIASAHLRLRMKKGWNLEVKDQNNITVDSPSVKLFKKSKSKDLCIELNYVPICI